MLTALQERKLDKAFDQMDVNHNTDLELDDLIALGVRVLAAFGVSPDSDPGRRLFGTYTDFWESLLAKIDLDGDRKISREEYRLGMHAAFIEDPDGYERALRPAIQATLDVTDVNGNGVLDLAEFQRFQSAFGTSPEDAELAFRKIDTDGSGALGIEELVEAGRQFYIGADPALTGNWLFGPV
ncbi:EF-hand domain-containing protein [Nonomuraea gerenzanensis]|uniref:Calcium binding protein n=1 Tax=Nonomuraea gerenzanensis TaxID=93944 RepID=A0A1M4EDP0_9ACTN|nr:EF-hand domain-containing protein [Nonomuraea gerenzanensis]UBU08491.1 EF-hand domain-containing protein [Nonomuraea gerenzanensis]SBO96836.1 calcium binding protein [Nonomuraea gerenzanensis]